MGSFSQPSIQYQPTMLFIDGGYLKKWAEDVCGIDREKFDYGGFARQITSKAEYGPFKPNLIRTYYYDGLANAEEDIEAHQKQKEFQNWLNSTFDNFEVRTSYLRKLNNPKITMTEISQKENIEVRKIWRQKGVDTLLSLDMIDKAASNQYDLAILVAGDLDHAETVKAVKSRGKQVLGVYRKDNTFKELIATFDRRHELKKDDGVHCILKREDWSPTWVEGKIR